MCGYAVDFVRSCYSSVWRFPEKPGKDIRGYYYFCDVGTPHYPNWHYFGSRNWHHNDGTPNPPFGETATAVQEWRNGSFPVKKPPAVLIGDQGCIELGAHVGGQPKSLLFGIDVRCWPTVPPFGGGLLLGGQGRGQPLRGGLTLGGQGKGSPFGGGLRIGGGGKFVPHEGGLLLGGVGKGLVRRGGLLLGGATVGRPLQGGLFLGGQARAKARAGGLSLGGAGELTTHEGGLLLGGSSETQDMYGGLRIGGAGEGPGERGGLILGGAGEFTGREGGLFLGGAGGGKGFSGGLKLGGSQVVVINPLYMRFEHTRTHNPGWVGTYDQTSSFKQLSLERPAGAAQISKRKNNWVDPGGTSQTMALAQVISPDLIAQTIAAGNWSVGFAGAFSQTGTLTATLWYVALYLMNGANNTLRTTIIPAAIGQAIPVDGSEYTLRADLVSGFGFTAVDGDYLVLEIYYQVFGTNVTGIDSSAFSSGATAIAITGTSTNDAQSFLQSPVDLFFHT